MTVVIAHRGASAAHPPGNTLAAFAAARSLGADWVELDVRITADDALVVHHDDHLADGGVIAELVAGDLPDWVPTLAAALDACAPMGVNVEIKVDRPSAATLAGDRLVDGTIALVLAAPPVGGLVVSCFDWSVADRIAREAPEVPTALLAFDLTNGPDMVEAAVTAGHRAINPWDPFVTPELVERAHGAGVEVHSWTVDDPARMVALAAMGVDGIITNVPDVARGCSTPRRRGARRVVIARPRCRHRRRRDDQVEHCGLVAQGEVLHLAQVIAVDLVGERPVARRSRVEVTSSDVGQCRLDRSRRPDPRAEATTLSRGTASRVRSVTTESAWSRSAPGATLNGRVPTKVYGSVFSQIVNNPSSTVGRPSILTANRGRLRS